MAAYPARPEGVLRTERGAPGSAPRRLRVTAEYISLHARRRPEHPALIGPGRSVTYAVFDQALRTITTALAGLGLAPGSLVAVFHDDPGVHLLLVLGFECLGIVVGQFKPNEGPHCEPLLADAALIVTPDTDLPTSRQRVLRITVDWWRRALSGEIRPGHECRRWQAAPDDPVLLNRSSGTTGPPKRMLVTRRMLETRVSHRCRLMRLTRSSRCLLVMPMKVAGSHYNIVAILRLGGTIVQPISDHSWQDMAEHRVTHATLLPRQLERLVDTLPAGFKPLADLTLCVIGARLTSLLRERALTLLCGEIVSVYSSNEAGTICVVRPDGEGELVSGIQVEIVDEAGQRLACGQVGQVRVKGEGIVAGYVDRGTQVSRRFADGWFASGDLGMTTGAGRLKVLGRFDDILNLGGIKVPCSEIEQSIMRRVRLRDVAVFMHDDQATGPVLVVCAVFHSPAELVPLQDSLKAVIDRPFSLWLVSAIPRTTEGKVQRRILRDMVGR